MRERNGTREEEEEKALGFACERILFSMSSMLADVTPRLCSRRWSSSSSSMASVGDERHKAPARARVAGGKVEPQAPGFWDLNREEARNPVEFVRRYAPATKRGPTDGWVDYSPPVVTQSNPSRPADGGGSPRRSTGGLACCLVRRRRPRRRRGLRIPDACLPRPSVRPSPSNPNPPLPSPSLCGASALGYGVSSPSGRLRALGDEQTKAKCPQPQDTSRRRAREPGGRRRSSLLYRSYRAGGWSRRGAATALGLGGSCLLRRARMAVNWCGQKLRLEVPISIF